MSLPVTKEQFLEALGKGKKCYTQKPKSWQKIWYWWEDPSEMWFMNVYKEEKKNSLGPGKGSWIIAKDLDLWLDMDERSGHKFYIHE